MTNKVTSFFDRAVGFYTKYFAVWVLVFGVVAYFKPDGFIALRSYNKLFFALTMFGIGAVLSFCTIGGVPDNDASHTWTGLSTHEIATYASGSSLRPTYNNCGIKGLTNGNGSITGTRMDYATGGYTPTGSNNYVIP